MRYLFIAVALVTVACGDKAPTGPTPITPPPSVVLPDFVCVSFENGHKIVVPCPRP